jgi:hypothetical protein
VSRLDSFIRRLEAQRACLDRAAQLIADLPGPALELGLGNGRTYDHLRELLPERAIYVFDRHVAAHPACIPPPEHLVIGDLRDTLVAARKHLGGSAALAHMDIGTGDAEASRKLAASLAPALTALLRAGAVVASEPPLEAPGLVALELPEGVAPGRYHLYRFSG